jgi:hypothetical protein
VSVAIHADVGFPSAQETVLHQPRVLVMQVSTQGFQDVSSASVFAIDSRALPTKYGPDASCWNHQSRAYKQGAFKHKPAKQPGYNATTLAINALAASIMSYTFRFKQVPLVIGRHPAWVKASAVRRVHRNRAGSGRACSGLPAH